MPFERAVSESERDPKRVLAAFAEQKLSLEISTLELCFLALLRLRAQAESLSAFSEEQLFDAFVQVCDAFAPDTENPRARATHAIRRFRDQRLLSRVDGAGVLRAGDFSLSPLAASVVDFYVSGEALTRQSLALLTRSLMMSLAEIVAAARKAEDETAWQQDVAAPLKVTVGDLLSGIETRQRGLDGEQEAFQKRIANLLHADWFGALEQCQELLETTAETLAELNDVLLRGSQDLSAQLAELLNLSLEAQAVEAEQATGAVIDQVDRIAAWGRSRQQAWSEYYEYVHRYLRDVVRFDPSRALTQRLRKLLAERGGGYSLTVAAAPPIAVLREVKAPEAPPPVRRKKKPTETPPAEEEAKPDPEQVLRDQVQELLQEGVSELAEVTARLTQGLTASERFQMAGRIAKALSSLRRPLAFKPRPWVVVDEDLAIEQWQMTAESES